uniref:glutathione gamma-glutamylcysteinyltransferase n=1 Tax=Lumbricus rubellus TaxID=35632 RepID=V9VGQ0_LUMRU|nr:phytochelatin synthase 1a [Lumbricus rubellus]
MSKATLHTLRIARQLRSSKDCHPWCQIPQLVTVALVLNFSIGVRVTSTGREPNTTQPFANKGKLSPKPITLNLPSEVHFYRRTLPRSCVSFTSDEGKEIFRDSLLAGDMNCYFQLASQYRTQDEPAFCGLSTLVMVLNTLEVDPKKVWKGPWRWYHEDMLDCCIPLSVVEETGITMDQFACLAECNMLNVKMVRTDEMASEDDFRVLIRAIAQSTDQVLVVTYSRACLDQTGDGHFSPIGGYNAKRDMVLIMDTARFKYPPHWVSLSALFRAMQRIDSSSGLSRGYFLLSKSDIRPGLIFRLSHHLSPMYLQNNSSQISTFVQSWERQIMTRVDVDCSTSDRSGVVVRLAVSRLLSLLNELDSSTFLLTAQADPTFSSEHSPLYGRDVRKMLSSMESLPIFHAIQEGVLSGKFPQASLEKAGVPGQSSSSLAGFEHTDVAYSVSSANLPCLRINANVVESVTAVHFLTMLILAWPYHHCGGERLCTELHRYTSVLLSRPDLELLKNEVARLRQQLTSILSYCKSCCHEDGCK